MEPIMKSLTKEQLYQLPAHNPETFEMYNFDFNLLPKSTSAILYRPSMCDVSHFWANNSTWFMKVGNKDFRFNVGINNDEPWEIIDDDDFEFGISVVRWEKIPMEIRHLFSEEDLMWFFGQVYHPDNYIPEFYPCAGHEMPEECKDLQSKGWKSVDSIRIESVNPT
tara:strand:+ start:393 stop:890 length:498 start_codon:yes stop_codon:yes gene_type:complete